jgi:hypothetical protein
MKTFLISILVVFALCFSVFGQAVTPPWPEGSFSAYFGPNQSLKLTVTTENGIVSVLNVPRGVFLNVVATEKQNPDFEEATSFPRSFRGDIIIRTRREDEIQKSDSRIAHEFMAASPLEMKLDNAVVLLEVVE